MTPCDGSSHDKEANVGQEDKHNRTNEGPDKVVICPQKTSIDSWGRSGEESKETGAKNEEWEI